jgi:hypothetical protein
MSSQACSVSDSTPAASEEDSGNEETRADARADAAMDGLQDVQLLKTMPLRQGALAACVAEMLQETNPDHAFFRRDGASV